MELTSLFFLVAVLVAGSQAGPKWGRRFPKPANCDEQCPPQCLRITDSRGCLDKCDCDPQCPTPSCEEGCRVEENVHGPCRGCVCDEEPSQRPSIPPTKDEEKDKVACSPPKCEPGCRVETQFDGPCPGCVCDDDKKEEDACEGPAADCKFSCRMKREFDIDIILCPGCDCEDEENQNTEKDLPGSLGSFVPTAKTLELRPWNIRPCDPPKCGEPGCRIVTQPGQKCPECKCEDDMKIIDPRCPTCEPGCSVQKTFEGPCPGCDCPGEELKEEVDEIVPCAPPKCRRGCRIQTVFDGPCPGCDCSPINKGPTLQCSPPKCGDGCRLKREPGSPCPVCDCDRAIGGGRDPVKDVQCDPPKCAPGCSLQKVFDGPCPGCDCPLEGKIPPVQCSPPKCEEGCSVETVFDGPCPGCKCKDDVKSEDSPFDDCELQECPPECPLGSVPGMPCQQCICKEDIQQCPPAPPCAGPLCQLELDGATGCRVCKCKPSCTPPKCKRFCWMKEGPSGCLECVCPSWRKRW